MRSALLEHRELRRKREQEDQEQPWRGEPILELQRVAGNQAVTKLLRDKKGQKAETAPTGLTKEEKEDKVRVLTDWIRFTPPTEFADQYGKNAPTTKDLYTRKLLEKIRGAPHVQESLKSKKNMQALAEDDDWGVNTYNELTLKKVVDDNWGKTFAGTIGKEFTPFDQHDCVFAAITHVLGFGDDLKSDIRAEKAVADAFVHAYGEVEDSILYRVMERLGWAFAGKFQKWEEFIAQAGGDTFIVSENKDAGGTTGHVTAVAPDLTAVQINGNGTKLKIYDRQVERKGGSRNEPLFAVYAWKVDVTSKVAEQIIETLSRG